MFLLVPAYPGCPGSKAVKRSLLLLLLLYEYVLSRLPEVVNIFPVITTVKHFQAAALRVNTVKMAVVLFRD